MEASRRRFLQLLAAVPALVLGRPARANTSAVPPEIHTETRNMRFGVLGRRWPREVPETPPARLKGKPARQLPTARHFGRSLADVVGGYQRGRRFGPAGTELSALASLLHFTNGVTRQLGRRTLRAAPSAGALYAGELYVAVARVEGLQPGLYYYDALRHRLLELRKGSVLIEVQAALERPAELENASFAIVLTNVFGRYSSRYANRAYRYALIDSGHIGENLRLTASSAGLADVSPLRFCDDALNGLLGVDGRSEAACALHAIGTPAGPRAEAATTVRWLVEKQELAKIPKGGGVTERYHEATKLMHAGSSASARVKPTGSSSFTTPTTQLPKPSSPTMTVEAAIDIRRSAEAFTSLPVQLADLSFILQMAAGSDALRRIDGVRLFTVVHRVVGLEPGVYEFLSSPSSASPAHSPAQGLALVSGGAMVDAMLRAVGQQMAGTAGVALVMAAKLSGGTSRLGERRYRDLLLESGAIAQRIYLAAESAGLAARNLAAFTDDDFNEALKLTALGLAGLHLIVIGNGN